MDKLFKVTGCYSFNKRSLSYKKPGIEVDGNLWVIPDPCFKGMVVAHGSDIYGYVYDVTKNASYGDRTYYLVGTIMVNPVTGNYGVAFYKLSNNGGFYPEMHVIPDLGDTESSYWKKHWLFHWLPSPLGRSRLIMTAMNHKDASGINQMMKSLDASAGINKKLLENLGYLKTKLQEAMQPR